MPLGARIVSRYNPKGQYQFYHLERNLTMKTTAFAILSFVLVCGTASYADTFGTDPNTMFEIRFVTVGNPQPPP